MTEFSFLGEPFKLNPKHLFNIHLHNFHEMRYRVGRLFLLSAQEGKSYVSSPEKSQYQEGHSTLQTGGMQETTGRNSSSLGHFCWTCRSEAAFS